MYYNILKNFKLQYHYYNLHSEVKTHKLLNNYSFFNITFIKMIFVTKLYII